ncbi:DUF1801 domain-containing protein [Leeia aquatica]|uniref:DUF1801 domain-containing protein n=1 Tax=Leeia aquatica TaxID=2725557 RepID=A0A847RZD6_9NEIS|nr:DUF1801 domain-containing protein [Leeia aquatica]NLR76480.1 DUF1801 domain-containing protein [Leeia aquatica]
MITPPSAAVLDWLARWPEPCATLLLQLRVQLLDAQPLQERLNLGWQGLAFHHATAGYVCGLFPQRDGAVHLLFEHGVELHDPQQRLLGDGKRCRHLRFETTDDVAGDELLGWLAEAVAIGQARKRR